MDKFFFQKNIQAECSSSGYRHADFSIWMFLGPEAEELKRQEGALHWSRSEDFSLQYQTHRLNRADENCLDEHSWYAESLCTHNLPAWNRLAAMAQFFKRMDTYYAKVHSKGLCFSCEDDEFYLRLELLKGAGAVECFYNRQENEYYEIV